MNLSSLISEINALKNPQKAKDYQWFFKTGKGQYGEGDKFLGITVPFQRKLVNLYWDVIDLSEVEKLLKSKFHEYRLTALLILVKKYPQSPKIIFDFYLKNTKFINNWDLVDLSASNIVGAYVYEHKNYSIIIKLSQSKDLWEKRISIISTLYLIKKGDYVHTLNLSRTLLSDPHDLIHKAVGWALREIGKKDQKVLTDFLDQYALKMSRTTLRYSIEKFPESLRLHYLKLKS